MIVRDEAPSIIVSLSSLIETVKITTWVIHDTGSQVSTPDLIREFFQARGLPGKLVHKKWESFGANRQYALEDAEGLSEYVFFFDADNLIEGQFPELPEGPDAFTLNMRRGTVVYPAKLIVRNNGCFRWRGVVHEGLYFNGANESGAHLAGDYAVISRSAGARSRDSSTYYRDARTLVQAIEQLSESDMDLLPRNSFYCANSWRDAHVPHEAIPWYRKRIALGGRKDEVYMSWFGLGIELAKTGDQDAALTAFMAGQEVCPERAECLYHAARLERLRGRFQSSFLFSSEGLKKKIPAGNRLFVWQDVYRFWMDFEFLLCLKNLNRSDEGSKSLARFRSSGAR